MNAYVAWVLRHRIAVIVATVLVTAAMSWFAVGLKIVIDPVTMAPQHHPYVLATKRIDAKFGSKYLMVIAITPEQGDVFQPLVLDTVQRMTRALETTPGVVRSSMVSLAARQAKGISGSGDAFEARPLLPGTPVGEGDIAALKAALAANPVYLGSAVSADHRTAAILVELKERSDGFRHMVEPVQRVVDAHARPGLKVALGGSPVYMETTERFADRINWLFPIALVVIGLLHFEAFRTRQGLVLPLVTAGMAVLWGLGFMGLLKQPLDIFNSPTPILILAVAAGHAVQLLKRYYEEYEALRREGALAPVAANLQAVQRSVAGVGPVMMIAGGVAALGFFSLMVFEIETIRTFGLFTGVGIVSAVVLEMTFIPAVRSLLRPPPDALPRADAKERIWDRIPRLIGDLVVPPRRRAWLMAGLVTFALLCAAGMSLVRVNSDAKTFFASFLQLQKDDQTINHALGGSNGLYVMVEGRQPDALKSPDLLRAVESLQRRAETLAGVGKTVSIVDYLKRMNQAMHGEDPAWNLLPATRELVSQYLLLYSMSGEPGDFDATIDSDFKTVKVTLLLKSGGSAQVRPVLEALQAHAAATFPRDVTVSFGGEAAQTIALSDTLIKGKLINIAQIAGAVFLVSALAFRSLLAGVVVLAPLAMAVLAVFGVMGAAGIPLNVPNSLISAMAVGIGADYAIYLLYRMRELARRGAAPEQAVRLALASAGKAALFVATAVAGGYGVLALSVGYNVHLWLSMFIVLAMVVSAAASLLLIPSVVLYLKPAFVFGSRRGGSVPSAVAALALGGFIVLAQPGDALAQESALAVMQKNALASKVQDSVTQATFTLISKDGSQRVRQTEGQTRLQDGGSDNMRRVRFTAPADIKGTSILLIERSKADDDMWLYLPALGKVRRLAAANKKDSFVGTDFSYADVMGHKPEQWTHKLLADEAVDGAPCFVVESLPADDGVRQTSGYGKRVSWVAKANFVALRTEIWDTALQPLKRITAADIQPVGKQRWQAMRTEAQNLQTGHRTLIQFTGFQADRGVPASLFTAKELEP
jgi:predicted RND superfamily exporter protein/outer membrane lipoprotein-sorting protein